MKSSAITFALLAILAGGASTVASAAGPEPTVSLSVPTHDLDLGSASGKAALKARLARAAAEVCGEASTSDAEGRRFIRDCRAQVVAAAEQEVAARLSGARLAAR